MEIRGMKHLSKNDYNSIIVHNGRINVYGTSTWPSLRLSHSIEDDLKILTDEDKERRIVEYFLDYSTLNFVSDNYTQFGKDYLYIGSTSGRTLKFGRQPYDDVRKKILKKYIQDRLNYFYNEDSMYYELSTTRGVTAYYPEGEDKVNLNFCVKDDKVLSFEEEFLQEFLPILFGDNEVSIQCRHTGVDEIQECSSFDGYYIVGTDKTIKIDLKLLRMISIIILNHNSKIRDNRRHNEIYKQIELKMEGF